VGAVGVPPEAVGVALEAAAPPPPSPAAGPAVGRKRRSAGGGNGGGGGGGATIAPTPPAAQACVLQPLRCGLCGETAGGLLDGRLAVFSGCLPGEG
jgi:hypothetical protein